jgi:hypothetical protein
MNTIAVPNAVMQCQQGFDEKCGLYFVHIIEKGRFFIPVYGRNEREIAAGAFYGGTVYTLIAGLF